MTAVVPWVALVGPELEENLGLRQLAAGLGRAGFGTAIVPFDGPSDLARVRDQLASAPSPPLLLGLSLAFQWRALDFLALALALREAGYRGHLTTGGHFATFRWRELLADFRELDSVCCFEADETIVELAVALRNGGTPSGIPGLACRAGAGNPEPPEQRATPDLATLPWPDRRGVPGDCLGHPIRPLVAGRGCTGDCAFCCIAAWHRGSGAPHRHRLRPVEDVADEMAWLDREGAGTIYIFHDDDFLPRGRRQALERVRTLAEALERRGCRRPATVIKARPDDLSPELLDLLRTRLGLIRVFVGIESGSEQGLATLRRGVRLAQNHEALALIEDRETFACFNLLAFDPQTTLDGLAANADFLERWAAVPSGLARVELYAGTPLLARLEAEGRCRGDYLGVDYDLADPGAQRVFELWHRCFHPRYFGDGATAHRLMGARFVVETARHFHPELWRREWLERSRALARRLATDSAHGLRRLIELVRGGHHAVADRAALVAELSPALRRVEAEVTAEAERLEGEIRRALGRRCLRERPRPVTLEILLPGDLPGSER